MRRQPGGPARLRHRRFAPALALALLAAWAVACGDGGTAPTDPDDGGNGGDGPGAPFEGTAATITVAEIAGLIADIAHDSTRGRASPSPELNEVAAYVAARFEASGLAPAGDDGYLQWFQIPVPGGSGDEPPVPNVIGWVEGSDPALRDEYVVLTAHFDHLGTLEEGSSDDVIYNGADDNASGTAALLEIADAVGAMSVAPKRSVVFLAVGGEELGLKGSLHYMSDPAFPIESTIANLNFDMVGRNEPDEVDLVRPVVSAFAPVAVAVAAQHPELGMTLNDRPNDVFIQRSDSGAFLLYGVESLFFHSGLHLDYHTVDDEIEWIDAEKVAKVAKLGYWTTVELAGRP
jgi:hypothetical protein